MKNEITQTRSDNTLENLDARRREWILEMAANARLADVAIALEKHGIKTSKASLSRFIRNDREKRLLEERKESQPVVEELAEHAKDGKLREGTLEAVRQRLYERALVSQSPEEARQLYAAMVKEEAKLQELELERRRVAIAEEELKLQRLRTEAEVASMRKPFKATVTESKAMAPGASEEVVEVGAGASGAKQIAAGSAGAGPSGTEKQLRELMGQTLEILNRGGDLGERMLEVRAILTEGLKSMQLT